MPTDVTELVWYLATLFGSVMLVVIWWVLRSGFTRMVTKLDKISSRLRDTELHTATLTQKVEDHINNLSLHFCKRNSTDGDSKK
jgi:hypothetical protein